ncbi:hypothetical protein, partial [Shewanella indica]|uniref:hypothetical protein n=1 Tax=Shewanella indica TaxID=768528 RepID=UPI003C76C6AF
DCDLLPVNSLRAAYLPESVNNIDRITPCAPNWCPLNQCDAKPTFCFVQAYLHLSQTQGVF